MNNTETKNTQQLKQFIWILVITWTIAAGGFLAWDIFKVRQMTKDLAINEARIQFNRDQAFRLWATTHGGFYVPVDDNTSPNPYLTNVPERDIVTPSGKLLTLMNPAYALRQMHEEFSELYSIAGHITSLNPLRPENYPDEWERAALEAFERGETEVREFTEIGDEPYLRLMQPLLTSEGCLKCHTQQGYQVGDLRGGVSISVPLASYLTVERRTISTHSIALGILWLIGLNGIFMGASSLGQHIQELDQSQKSLQEEKEYKEAILHSVGEAIVMSDREGQIQYINEAYTSLNGYTPEEVKGRPMEFIVNDINAQQYLQSQRIALAKGEIWQGELIVRRKDGRTYEAALTIAPIHDDKARFAGHVTSHRDVSKYKELERAKSRFITNVSHELRTPLANVKLYTQLLQTRPESEKTERYIQVLMQQVARLEVLTQDILDIAVLDSGQRVTVWEPVSLTTLIGDVVTRFQNQVDSSGLTLIITPVSPDFPVVKGDQCQLARALGELVENAIIFTPAGGQVTIDVKAIKDENDHWVTIAVKDTGPGISPDEQERIFDRFYRGKQAESGHIPGPGLGLSYAQAILQAHGGQVTVESEEGKGSSFILWLKSFPNEKSD